MSVEITDDEQELELKRKLRQKTRIRGLLIGINAVLFAYLLFNIGASVGDYIYSQVHKDDNKIISLCGKSVSASKKIYNDYINNYSNGVDSIADYAIYGGSLLLSENHVTLQNPSSYERLVLTNVCNSKIIYSNDLDKTIGEHIDEGIDLFSLDKGDYLVYANYVSNKGKLLKIESEEGIDETIYSPLKDNGKRTKITVKSKSSSPCLVISVSDANILPKDYYDLILIGSEEKVNAIADENLKIKKITGTDSLVEAYKTKAPYVVCFDSSVTEVTSSSYLSDKENVSHDETFTDTSLVGIDKNKFIRELGGYLFNAGYSAAGVDDSHILTPYLTNSHIGKEVIVAPLETTLDTIKKVFSL